MENGTQHSWTERWLVTRSDALAQRKQKTWRKRLERAEARLSRLKPKKEEDAAALLARAEDIVKRYKMTSVITVQVHETVTQEKRYIGPGRPGPNRPFELREKRHLQVTYERDEAALAEILALAGWRIYVTNVAVKRLSLDQAITSRRRLWRH